jgi:hypothetical protein
MPLLIIRIKYEFDLMFDVLRVTVQSKKLKIH